MSKRKKPTVRPRFVWLGLIVGLAGAIVIGLGVSFQSWAWAIPGIVVLAIGAALGMRGGVMYDANKASVGDELKEAVHGDTREGIKPGEMIDDPKARETSYELDRLRRAATASSRQAPRPPLAHLGAILAVLVGVFLLGAQWSL